MSAQPSPMPTEATLRGTKSLPCRRPGSGIAHDCQWQIYFLGCFVRRAGDHGLVADRADGASGRDQVDLDPLPTVTEKQTPSAL
jgi:hypothetical protein